MHKERFEAMVADFQQLFAEQRTKRRRRMEEFFALLAQGFAETGKKIEPKQQTPQEPIERLRDFFSTWEKERPQPAVDFNVFPLLRVNNDEVIHSRFLSWLFDRRESHGQQHLFAGALLELCGLYVEEETLQHYSVYPEFSQAESIIDIVIYRQWDFIVYLENKINAGEQSDQLAREYRDMRRLARTLHVPEDRQIAVFLTPTGRKPVSDDAARWLCISYPQFADTLRPTLDDISDPRTKFIVGDWLKTADSLR
ncbi:MAG: PD-(D/E)XK nuclease family protein [Armatimonadota bacterium]